MLNHSAYKWYGVISVQLREIYKILLLVLRLYSYVTKILLLIGDVLKIYYRVWSRFLDSVNKAHCPQPESRVVCYAIGKTDWLTFWEQQTWRDLEFEFRGFFASIPYNKVVAKLFAKRSSNDSTDQPTKYDDGICQP